MIKNMDVATKLSDSLSYVLNFSSKSNADEEKPIPFFVPKLFRENGDKQAATTTTTGYSQQSPNVQRRTMSVQHNATSTSTSGGSSNSSTSTPSRPGTPQRASLVGGINPALYRYPEDGELCEYPENHIGRIWFTLEYDKDAETLSVAVVKIRNLPSRELMTPNCCDPFVRVYLLPDERRYSQTKTRRKTCNPKYEDNFTFDISKELFDERAVKLVVYDVDNLKRNIPIGLVVYNLREYTICKQRRLTTWKDLKKDDTEVVYQLGEVLCSLCYNDTLQRLSVDMIGAKDLKPTDAQDTDTYVKVILSIGAKQVKWKKTHVVKNNLINPVYKESFTFSLPPDRLDQACVCVQVMQNKNDVQIGRVVLGGSMMSRGKGLQHWQAMIRRKKDVVQEWHYLTE